MISAFFIPVFILVVFIAAAIKKLDSYSLFISGIKDGFKNILIVAPTMFCMYVSINLFAKSGFITDIFKFKNGIDSLVIQIFFRPFSSQASLGFMLKIYEEQGAQSKISYLSSLIQASTDSSFYIISFYLGAFSIKKYKKCFLIGFIVNIFAIVLSFLFYILFL